MPKTQFFAQKIVDKIFFLYENKHCNYPLLFNLLNSIIMKKSLFMCFLLSAFMLLPCDICGQSTRQSGQSSRGSTRTEQPRTSQQQTQSRQSAASQPRQTSVQQAQSSSRTYKSTSQTQSSRTSVQSTRTSRQSYRSSNAQPAQSSRSTSVQGSTTRRQTGSSTRTSTVQSTRNTQPAQSTRTSTVQSSRSNRQSGVSTRTQNQGSSTRSGSVSTRTPNQGVSTRTSGVTPRNDGNNDRVRPANPDANKPNTGRPAGPPPPKPNGHGHHHDHHVGHPVPPPVPYYGRPVGPPPPPPYVPHYRPYTVYRPYVISIVNPIICSEYANRYNTACDNVSAYVSDYGTLVYQPIDDYRAIRLVWADCCIFTGSDYVYIYTTDSHGMKIYKQLDRRTQNEISFYVLVSPPSNLNNVFARRITVMTYNSSVFVSMEINSSLEETYWLY